MKELSLQEEIMLLIDKNGLSNTLEAIAYSQKGILQSGKFHLYFFNQDCCCSTSPNVGATITNRILFDWTVDSEGVVTVHALLLNDKSEALSITYLGKEFFETYFNQIDFSNPVLLFGEYAISCEVKNLGSEGDFHEITATHKKGGPWTVETKIA